MAKKGTLKGDNRKGHSAPRRAANAIKKGKAPMEAYRAETFPERLKKQKEIAQLRGADELRTDKDAKENTPHNPTAYRMGQNFQYSFPKDIEQDFEQGHYILFHFLMDPRNYDVPPLMTLGRVHRSLGLNADSSAKVRNASIQKGSRRFSQSANLPGKLNDLSYELGLGQGFQDFHGMKRSNMSVALFMPGDVKASYGHTYQDATMGALGVVGMTAAEGLTDMAAGAIRTITDLFKPGTFNIKTGFQGPRRIGRGVSKVMSNPGAGETFATDAINAVGQQFGALPATARQIVNPRIEFLYQATAPREFSYTFKMNARDSQESEIIFNIVQAFKQWSHAQVKESSSGNILRYPGEFEIEYMSYGQTNQYLNNIANCVLTGMNVDYSTDGNFQAFYHQESGSPPVTVTLSLNFKETDMLTSDMISEGGF